MSETRTVHDPFFGKDVQISDRLVDRLRGKYACGPILPNGEPEFGWRQFETPPIQHEAANEIDRLRLCISMAMGCIDPESKNSDERLAWHRLYDALQGREPLAALSHNGTRKET